MILNIYLAHHLMSRRRSQYVNDFDDQSNIHVFAQKGTQVVFIIQTFSNILELTCCKRCTWRMSTSALIKKKIWKLKSPRAESFPYIIPIPWLGRFNFKCTFVAWLSFKRWTPLEHSPNQWTKSSKSLCQYHEFFILRWHIIEWG